MGTFPLWYYYYLWRKVVKKMSSLHLTLYEFKEALPIPQSKIFLKKEFSIVIYCWQDDINIKRELDFLNNMYIKHDLKRWNYLPFEVTEYISVTKVYPSTYIFTSRKQYKMEIIPLSKTIEYFDNMLDQNKVKNLHSICIARGIRFLAKNVCGHNDHYWCQCFKLNLFSEKKWICLMKLLKFLPAVMKFINSMIIVSKYIKPKIVKFQIVTLLNFCLC